MLKLLQRFSGLAALMTFVLGIWAVAQARLLGEDPRGLIAFYVPMVPSTAVFFILLGGAHGLYRLDRARSGWRWVERAAAIVAILGVLLVQSQDVSAAHDFWRGVAAVMGGDGAHPLGRMAPSSSVAFVLTAVAMLAGTCAGARMRRLCTTCAALGVGLACFGLTRVVASLPTPTSRPMALMAAVGFLLLNLALLLDSSPLRDTSSPAKRDGGLSLRLVAAALLIILVTASAGSIYMRRKAIQARAAISQELESIADLKAAEILAWRRARMRDGRFVLPTFHVAGDVAKLAADPRSQERRAHLADWLAPLLADGAYRSITVLGPNGAPLFSIPDGIQRSPPDADRRASPHDAELGDIRATPEGDLSLDLVVPLGPQAHGALIVFDIDPRASLFPLLQTAPSPIRSLESTLSRREGNEIVLLGGDASGAATRSRQRYPVSERDLPEARAARGESDARESVDSRGVGVLATSRAIPGSSWILTTRIDQQELYGPLRAEAARTALFVIVLLFGLIALAAYVAQEENGVVLEQALVAERERASAADRLATFMKNANDMILLFDDQDRIVEVSDRVPETYGYSREELIGMDVARLRADGSHAGIGASREALAAPGGGRFESVHRRKDGTIFPIEVSGRTVKIDGKPVAMAIYRDISERRAQEAALRQSEERLRRLGDNLPDSYLYQYMSDSGGERRFVYVSSGVEKVHGVSVDAVLADATLLNRQTVAADLAQVVAGETASLREMKDFSAEIRIRRPDGEERWLQIRSRPRRSDGGTVVWDGVATDVTDRKRADAALRQVQSAVEQSPISILIADPDWTIRYVNPAFTEITGYAAAEAIGRNPRDLLGDNNPQELHEEADRCLQEGRVWEGVFRNRRKNGERFWEQSRLAPVRDANGVTTSYIAVKEDITARREWELALRNSQSKLAEAIDVADLGCYETWEEEGRVECDARIAQLLGLQATSTTQMRDHWIAHVHPEDLDRILPQAQAVWTGAEERFDVQYRYIQPNQNEIWVSHASRIVDRAPDGKVRRTIGVVKDITAEKAASEAIRKSEERHRLLADNASDVIWTTDTEGRMTYVSPSVERLRGYGPGELLGRSFVSSVTAEHREPLSKMFAGAVAEFQSGAGASPRPSQRFEVDQPCKDGSIVHTEVTASPMFDGEHRFVGVLGVTRDMTARHAADLALKASEFRLQMAIEMAELGIVEVGDGKATLDAAACDILGLEPGAESAIETWLERVHPEDRTRISERREAFRRGDHLALSTEYRYLHPTRGEVWINHASRTLERETPNHPFRAVNVFKDITVSRRAEQDLRESQSRLRIALDAAELGLYWTNRVDFDCDERERGILGLPSGSWDEVLAFWTRRLHPDDRERILDSLQTLRDGGAESIQLEYRYEHREHGLLWISHAIRAVAAASNGAPNRVIGIVKDVTASREAAEALRRSEERFRAGLTAIQEGFVVFDRSKQVVVANATATRILGLGAGDDVPPTGPREFRTLREDGSAMPPDEYPSSRTLRDGVPIRNFVMGIERPDSPTVWLLVSSAPIGDSALPEMVVVSFTDVTARRAAEADLQRAEERWKFAIEGAGDGVWDWDVAAGTCVFSPRWKAMLGFRDDEIGADLKEWTERVHPDDLPRVMEALQPHLDGREASYVAEHRLRCKDGSYKWVLDRGLVVSRGPDGRALRVVGTHSDVTARRQAEEDLRNLAATRAQQLDELRRWQQAMLGREDRIQELKREANALARLAGKEPPYPSQEPVV